ncbi:U32 family peptidase [Candidatus Soleaferrea massiliensis]|uniref:U32 family peptidase n=1 Tax=Candidatus Soleaferrea massiliensis TaxID=1470354 RepID=UPI00058C9DED|nr:U32 family peptidase [Candidatus Soleaferrea massiliensis]
MNQLEILAPCGGMESVQAAVHCGADAVYLGAKELNARRNAANFDEAELNEAAAYCHLNGVKVYLTLNTVLLDSEFELAGEVLRSACAAGIDAVIVDDLGLVRFVKEHAPNLRLHASTQMSIHNLEGVRMLEELGFHRVVLARELSLDEIRRIAEHTSVELEVFVHGALCMCVSGQCYLSSMIGQRSGNRGLCAQPCRLKFSNGGNENALSLKDLSLIDHIPALRDAGVTSIKIEGRMKRPEYVAAAVKACHNAREGMVDFTLTDQLSDVFSRSGFTDGYLTGKRGPQMFGIRRKEDVLNMTGVLKELGRLAAKETPRVGVSFAFTLKAGQPAVLCAADADGNRASAAGDIPEKALNKPTDAALVEKSLQKTGGTPFYPENIDCDIDEGLVLSISKINLLRRAVLEDLMNQRSAVHQAEYRPSGQASWPSIQDAPEERPKEAFHWRARYDRFEQVSASALEQLGYFSLPLSECVRLFLSEDMTNEAERFGLPDMRAFLDAYRDQLIIELPRGMFGGNQIIMGQLEKLRERGITHLLAHNLGAVWIGRELNYRLHGGFGLNVTNARSLEVYRRLGLEDMTLSFELSMLQISAMEKHLPAGILCYGHLPMMLTRNCPIQTAMGCKDCGRKFRPLVDRMGNEFPVACENTCAELYNHLPLYIAEQPERFEPLAFATLYFTKEDRARCDELISMHLEHRKTDQPATKGLYYRGVL